MILENTILFYIGFKGKRYIKYKQAGFTPDKNGYIQITPAQIQQLTPSSTVSFMCECDHCHKQFSLRILSYTPKDDKILCRQCKIANTNLERYGGITPFVSEKVKEKAKQTNLERYGVEHAAQNDIIKEKTLNTFMKNNTVKTSKFQKKLHNILGGELNHLACQFFLDIALIDNKIDIEYDGGGHDLAVKFQKYSPKQFKNKEIQRDYILMRNGWKIIRLISPQDKLFDIYTEQQLVQLVNIATQYLRTTNHHWVNLYLEENRYECSQLKANITDILNM